MLSRSMERGCGGFWGIAVPVTHYVRCMGKSVTGGGRRRVQKKLKKV